MCAVPDGAYLNTNGQEDRHSPKAGIQNVRDLNKLDSGSPLRSARNDGAFELK